jgi:hypothetical protein
MTCFYKAPFNNAYIRGPFSSKYSSCLRHWDTLAGFSQDFVWDFVRQLLFLSKMHIPEQADQYNPV